MKDTSKSELCVFRNILPVGLFADATKKLRGAHHCYNNLNQCFYISAIALIFYFIGSESKWAHELKQE
ncbi:hypothetical protein VDIAB_100778 [Vibrio diabolicus]|nr:hypothetical protein VDIAB_100778 [Vibrio diabolicus]